MLMRLALTATKPAKAQYYVCTATGNKATTGQRYSVTDRVATKLVKITDGASSRLKGNVWAGDSDCSEDGVVYIPIRELNSTIKGCFMVTAAYTVTVPDKCCSYKIGDQIRG